MNSGKTADSIEMLFDIVDQFGTRNRVLDGDTDPLVNGNIFGRGIGWHNVTYRKNATQRVHNYFQQSC